jgi:hypothetical protein
MKNSQNIPEEAWIQAPYLGATEGVLDKGLITLTWKNISMITGLITWMF